MLEQKELKLLRLNVNKTNMVKLCKFYFHEILNKKLSDFFFFKYQRDSFYVLECSGYEFHLFVNCCKVLLTERNSDVSYIVDYDDLFKFDLVKEIC